MKKIFVLMLALIMVLSLVGCAAEPSAKKGIKEAAQEITEKMNEKSSELKDKTKEVINDIGKENAEDAKNVGKESKGDIKDKAHINKEQINKIKGFKIDLGESELYTEQERRDVISLIEEHLEISYSVEMLSVRYVGDKESQEYCEGLKDAEGVDDFSQSMVFMTTLQTVDEELEPEECQPYEWLWCFGRQDGGEWFLLPYNEQ